MHGFGFAAVLREFGLPQAAVGWSLFGFNLGGRTGPFALVVPLALAWPRSSVNGRGAGVSRW